VERRLHLVSLGCPKNRVDSEVLLGRLLGRGWTVAPDPADADAIVQRLREEALACAGSKPPAGCPEAP